VCDKVIRITATLRVCGVIPQLKVHTGAHMPDAFADSTARLERLLEQIMRETDPIKYDDLGAEIWRVLHERAASRAC
jgi:hypothetical protein